ncbi:daptomycin-sensing surface protein LiaX [Enterococcus timonensis]|uniref:daptomycin-sensing surface protein LiaX n=1 Tax=Enterococcus timonensis TaxID=1852364 RepID=UPI0008D9971F|nr:daptomycin-sensing surface protein LiaX [Enterococcus timonensis]
MQDRERILELVKKGVLSTEEALVLLESMAQDKDEKNIQKAADKVSTEKVSATKDFVEPTVDQKVESTEDPTASEAVESAEEKAAKKAAIEKTLAQLAEAANQTSAQLDGVNAEISSLKNDLKAKREEKQVFDTMDELGTLTESKEAQRQDVVNQMRDLDAQLAQLQDDQKKLEADLKNLNKERFHNTKEKVQQKFDIPEDWKDQTKETMNQVGGKVYEASNQLGSFLKKTFNGLADVVNDNVDWKEVNFRVPGVATTKFSHTFNYPENKASLIDVKLANGDITFEVSDSDDLRVEADIKLYGKMEGTPLQAFLEKSQIDVDDEVISFQIPNKRVRADLVFYLPEKTYDHVSLKLLNGDIEVSDLKAKDVYAKSTNGDIDFSEITASMLEIHGVNGDVDVENSELLDLSVESVNGDITTKKTNAKTINTSLVNGDIRLTVSSGDLRSIEASSVNGEVKIALPKDLSIAGTVKTSFGSVKHRLSQLDVLKERASTSSSSKSQYLEFERLLGGDVANVNAATTTGSIYLKDTEE